MPLKDVVKVSRKTFFNPRSWFGYDMLATQTRINWNIIKGLYSTSQPAGRPETFDEAVKRFDLSAEQLQQITHNFFIYMIILVSCAVITIAFSIYLLLHHGTFAGFVLGIATTALFLAYAFRFSFWRFQIIHKKLGCTFDEWRRGKPDSERGAHP